MDNFDIPIFKKSYELYKTFHEIRRTVPKQDRFTVFERCENILLDVIENILKASQTSKQKKLEILEKASVNLNLLRMFVRLLKDIRTIDNKKYIIFEANIDEIGRMLGGWIKSINFG